MAAKGVFTSFISSYLTSSQLASFFSELSGSEFAVK